MTAEVGAWAKSILLIWARFDVFIIRMVLSAMPGKCGAVVNFLIRHDASGSRYIDGLLKCLLDRPELDEHQWRSVARWLGDALAQAILKGPATQKAALAQALNLAARLKTWRWSGEMSPEAHRAWLLACQVARSSTIWSLASSKPEQRTEATYFVRLLFILDEAEAVASLLAVLSGQLSPATRETLENLAVDAGCRNLAERWLRSANPEPELTIEETPSAMPALDICQECLSAGDDAGAIAALKRALAETPSETSRIILVLDALLKLAPSRCPEVIDLLALREDGASVYLNGLLYCLQDRPVLEDRQWDHVERWLARACVFAIVDHREKIKLDRPQAFYLASRIPVWRKSNDQPTSKRHIVAAARQLALDDLTFSLIAPLEISARLAIVNVAAKALINLGEAEVLEAFLEAPPVEIEPYLWIAITEVGTEVARREARSILMDWLVVKPAERETVLRLARIAPEVPEERVSDALFRAAVEGVDVAELTGAWISGLLVRGGAEGAMAAVQVMKQLLGLAHLGADATLADALEASEALQRTTTIPAFRLLARHYSRHSLFALERRVLVIWFGQAPKDIDAAVELGTALIAQGYAQAALDHFDKCRSRLGEEPELLIVEAEACTALGRRADLIRLLERIRELGEMEGKVSERVYTRTDWLNVQIDTGNILARVPVARPIRGIVAILTVRSPLIVMWSALVACELRKKGYDTVFIDAPACAGYEFTSQAIGALHGLVTPQGLSMLGSLPKELPHPDWQECAEKRTLTRSGYDIYQPVYERIATTQRRYTIIPGSELDWVRQDAMIRADVAIEVCENLAAYARSNGKKIIIITSMTHYSPACIYRQFANRKLPGVDVEFVEVNVGYEAYKSNDVSAPSYSISIGNLSRNRDQRASYHTNRRAFETWLAKQPAETDDLKNIRQILNADRSRKLADPAADALRQRMIEHRSRGGRIVCLMGKITYDISIEFEGGPGHRDMEDWLNHSIEAVTGKPDTLLIIKPHPYEIVPEVAQPRQCFADLIQGVLPDNCVVLGHRWFNLAEVLPLVDAVSIWHGTAVLEAISQGVPVIVSATCGVLDHPIDVVVPIDRQDYERLLTVTTFEPVSESLQHRARKLIEYLVSDEIIIPYPYASLYALRNAGTRRWGWHIEKVERYLEHGDRYIAYAADICEFGQANLQPDL